MHKNRSLCEALPKALRSQAVKVAYEDHAGVTRCKHRLRSKLWWPGMDKDIETHIKTCLLCQVTGQPSPLTPLPNGPWEYLDLHLCSPFPTGEHAPVMIDYYSRWAEVEITTTTTSARMLKWLDFLRDSWLSSHVRNQQRKIFQLCRIPRHPQSMENQTPYVLSPNTARRKMG